MINSKNFVELLKISGFTQNEFENYFSYDFGSCTLEADIKNEKLIYPEKIRGRERNNNFNANENFVVFECVYRLLKKGYRPEDIELEKLWSLGHNAKSGRADICVYDKDNSENVLMIIECKTWGKEFEKAFNDTKNDGGQLFSYWQQESSTKWLVLYSSDIKDGAVNYKSPAIDCTDDNNLKLQSEYDEDILLYEKAFTAEKKFEAWNETYHKEIHDDIIFSDNSTAYDIGIKPLRKKDLKDFENAEKIVNAFEEILRHNNVSDKENAFNRLIALFICKLVDEINKSEDDEVDFQYKHRIDDYEALQDRLQRLYTEGMENFMREKITYVPIDYPENLFQQYNGGNRKNAIEDLRKTIRKLKFYSNNDFAFKDVHNEELFYQNGKILVEVVQLFQKYKIIHPSKPDLLGNLFEQLLDKGFKQNEGQFFTPIPITRFIWDCLPLKNFETWPKVIDYACGAGHFLTEAIGAINHFIDNPEKNNSWTRDCIFGIEKDYRLARVSKVSLFMNDAGDGNIIFGDGLENTDKIQPEDFDILTANPPYSVASFKGHLKLKNNKLNLLDKITFNGSEIEVLFVERIAQLLKSGGIAAVILPSSILSNDSCYTDAREEILKNFLIRSIVKLGSKTFGATGTNTVIMFLEKYKEPPKRYKLVLDSADAIFDERNLEDWEDKDILNGYLEMQGLSFVEWKNFVNGSMDINGDDVPEYFKNYVGEFKRKNDVAKILASNRTEEEKNLELRKKFYEWAKELEREKIFYYGLTYSQRTVVILAPSDNAGQKEFLGYDWSNRKGSEGIQISVAGGKLYDKENREAEGTLAHVVRQSFGYGYIDMTEDNENYANSYRTCNMIDFSQVKFNKAIKLQPSNKISNMNGKKTLAQIIDVVNERIETSLLIPEQYVTTENMLQNCNGITKFNGVLPKGSVFKFRKGDILLSNIRPYLQKIWYADFDGGCSTNVFIFRSKDKKLYNNKFIFYMLSSKNFFDFVMRDTKGLNMPQGKREHILDYVIPLPPMEVQRQIVSECEKIDDENKLYKSEISSCNEKIENIFSELETKPKTNILSLTNRIDFSLNIGKRVLNSELIDGGTIPVYSANVFEPFGYTDRLLEGFKDFSKDLILWGIDGDFMVNFIPKGNKFYPTDHCGVLRVLTDKVHPRYMAEILKREGQRMNFSRSYRASLERVSGIRFEVPDTETQNSAMKEVLELEAKISEAEKKLQSLSGMKETVLKKYL